ncbi:MAG TPA: RlmE family RNA methyltransferase [Deltaproteobacteria bacterium]|nr:RlmE family RNA methyltransferase [Deltaproteobacteria bacterium]
MEPMYERKDAYYRKAKQEGFRSRAAYKLAEIARAHKIARPGECVVDAGAAPGGWSQVLLRLVGTKGKVAAVDLLPMEPLPGENFRFFRTDIAEPSLPEEILSFFGRTADAVVSDAAPNTSGVSVTDRARSADLVLSVLSLAGTTLREGGTFLAKIFEGPEADEVFRELQGKFSKVIRVRPGATRKESSELYLLARGFRG